MKALTVICGALAILFTGATAMFAITTEGHWPSILSMSLSSAAMWVNTWTMWMNAKTAEMLK